MVTVTEDEIRATMRRLAREARLIAEPAGAVATAAYLYHRDDLPAATTYVSLLSGGNVDPALFLDVLK
jgi:threonine dehydratase